MKVAVIGGVMWPFATVNGPTATDREDRHEETHE